MRRTCHGCSICATLFPARRNCRKRSRGLAPSERCHAGVPIFSPTIQRTPSPSPGGGGSASVASRGGVTLPASKVHPTPPPHVRSASTLPLQGRVTPLQPSVLILARS